MNRVNHFEIVAEDIEKTIAFYQKVFGWKIEKWNGPIDYWLIMTGDPDKPGIDGGLGKKTSEEEIIVNFIDVPDIVIAIKNIEENGGEITRPKALIPGVGWLAYFKDPEGTIWGIMQSVSSTK